jgi:hypothetical protein
MVGDSNRGLIEILSGCKAARKPLTQREKQLAVALIATRRNPTRHGFANRSQSIRQVFKMS